MKPCSRLAVATWAAGLQAGWMTNWRRLLIGGLVVTTCLSLVIPGGARADSVYLENGRVIRTEHAELVGDKVVLLQYGARQSIPRDRVARVVRDERRGPRSTPARRSRAVGLARIIRRPAAPVVARYPSVVDATTAPGFAGGALTDLAAGSLAGRVEGGGVLPTGLMAALAQVGPMLSAASGSAAGAEGVDPGQVAAILPLVQQLAELLVARDPSPEAARSTASELLGALRGMGVSSEMIRARAAELGIPLAGIEIPGF